MSVADVEQVGPFRPQHPRDLGETLHRREVRRSLCAPVHIGEHHVRAGLATIAEPCPGVVDTDPDARPPVQGQFAAHPLHQCRVVVHGALPGAAAGGGDVAGQGQRAGTEVQYRQRLPGGSNEVQHVAHSAHVLELQMGGLGQVDVGLGCSVHDQLPRLGPVGIRQNLHGWVVCTAGLDVLGSIGHGPSLADGAPSVRISGTAKLTHVDNLTASRSRGLVLVITAGVLWGTGGIAGSLLLTAGEVHPFGTAAYRLLGGGLLASLVLLALGRLRTVPRTARVLRRLVFAGLFLAVFQAGYFAAIEATSVSLATLLTIGSVPVLVTVGTCLLDRRLPGPRLVSAIVVALAGLGLLAGSPGLDVPPGQLAVGVGCALLAGLAFTLVTLMNRHVVPGLDPLTVTAVGCLVGGLLLVPLGLAFGMAVSPNVTALTALAYLAALPTAAAYLAYFSGLRSAPATAAALAVILEPLTATVLAVLLLDESLSGLGLIGAVLLLLALVLDYWRPTTPGEVVTAAEPARER